MRLGWLVAGLVVLAACPKSREAYEEEYPEILCEKFAECVPGMTLEDCLEAGQEDPVDTSDCDFDADAAADCKEGTPDAPCGSEEEFFLPRLPESCERIYDCGDDDDDGTTIPKTELPVGNDVEPSNGGATQPASGATDQRAYGFVVLDSVETDTPLTSPGADIDNIVLIAGDIFRDHVDGARHWLIVEVELAEAPPTPDTTYEYQYGWVFETDGSSTNDWTGIPAYPNDFFIGTDRWYELKRAKGSGWVLAVSEIDADQNITSVESEAQVGQKGASFFLAVPTEELGAAPDMRITAFKHDGSWLDGDWNADYYPLVGELIDLGDL